MKFSILVFFEHVSRKLQDSLKSDNNNGYFTRMPKDIYLYYKNSLISS